MKKTIKRRNIRRRRHTQKGKGLLPDIFKTKKNKIYPDNTQHSYSQQPSFQNKKKPSNRGRRTRRTYDRTKYTPDPTLLPKSWYEEYDKMHDNKNENPNPNTNPNPNKSESKSTM
jgi:hypothetical protein